MIGNLSLYLAIKFKDFLSLNSASSRLFLSGICSSIMPSFIPIKVKALYFVYRY